MTDRFYSESICGCQFTHHSLEGVDTNTERTKSCETHKEKN